MDFDKIIVGIFATLITIFLVHGLGLLFRPATLQQFHKWYPSAWTRNNQSMSNLSLRLLGLLITSLTAWSLYGLLSPFVRFSLNNESSHAAVPRPSGSPLPYGVFGIMNIFLFVFIGAFNLMALGFVINPQRTAKICGWTAQFEHIANSERQRKARGRSLGCLLLGGGIYGVYKFWTAI